MSVVIHYVCAPMVSLCTEVRYTKNDGWVVKKEKSKGLTRWRGMSNK